MGKLAKPCVNPPLLAKVLSTVRTQNVVKCGPAILKPVRQSLALSVGCSWLMLLHRTSYNALFFPSLSLQAAPTCATQVHGYYLCHSRRKRRCMHSCQRHHLTYTRVRDVCVFYRYRHARFSLAQNA